jgi:4-hydroxymandelate oxidase
MKNQNHSALPAGQIETKEKQLAQSPRRASPKSTDDGGGNFSFNRRNLLKMAALVGGGGLIGPALASAAELTQQPQPAAQTNAPAASARPRNSYNDILAKAREQLYPACRVCPVCDGVACSGDGGGMAGAGTGMSFQNNFTALQRVKLVMRTVHDVRRPDTSTTIFGRKLSFPAMGAPMGPVGAGYGKGMPKEEWFPRLLGGCVDANTIGGMGDNFQTYPVEDVKRNLATLAGLGGKGFYHSKPNPNEMILKWREQIEATGAAWLSIDLDSGPKSPAQLRELVKAFKIPIVIKGIMTLDDAMRCIDAGIAGIAVSNHGGRRLDHTLGTAEALPPIAEKLKGKIPILADSCVATGADVLKYLALGADVVMVGRHLVRAAYGGGREGVAMFMNKMRTEFQSAMVLTGVPSVAKIDGSIIHV